MMSLPHIDWIAFLGATMTVVGMWLFQYFDGHPPMSKSPDGIPPP